MVAQAEFNERLHAYEAVIDAIQCGLLIEEPDGTITFANGRILRWLGYDEVEVVGASVDVLVPKELVGYMELDRIASEEGDNRARLLALRRKDGTTFPVVALPQVLLDSAGRPEAYVHIVVDLGSVMTARRVGPDAVDVRGTLGRIALELQSISLSTSVGALAAVPLHHPDLAEISERETEVLTLLIAGTRVPAIATHLHISPHTVRNHLKSMYRKLDVGSQTELIERVRELASASA